MAKKDDFFNDVTCRGVETVKAIQNWITTIKKKRKCTIESFSDIFAKFSGMTFPIEIVAKEEGFYKIHDSNEKKFKLICYPYGDKKLESFSIVDGTDEFIYEINLKGVVNIKGIMEYEPPVKEVETTPANTYTPNLSTAGMGGAPVINVSATSMANLEEALKKRFGDKLDDEEYEMLKQMFVTATQASSLDAFIGKIRQ